MGQGIYTKLVWGVIIPDEIVINDELYEDDDEDAEIEYEWLSNALYDFSKFFNKIYPAKPYETKEDFIGFSVGATHGMARKEQISLEERFVISGKNYLDYFLKQIPQENQQQVKLAWEQFCKILIEKGEPFNLLTRLEPGWLLVSDWD